VTKPFHIARRLGLFAAPTCIPLGEFPLRIVRVARNNANRMTGCAEALGETACVRGVARGFGPVVQADDGYAQFGCSHKCKNSGQVLRRSLLSIRETAMGNEMDKSRHVIDLSRAPGERSSWGRPRWVVYAWAAMELVFVSNPWQVSSRLRVSVLRLFGAQIGEGVIYRPRTRVKFPWKLHVGDRCWIGEGVWIHNQDSVFIGHDVVVSQETMITTGSHALRRDMALLTKPTVIEDGAWITSRCLITGGVTIGASAVVEPMSLISRDIPAETIVKTERTIVTSPRFNADN
jgi:putative colanic acid biosynthesis acetyltransferase WcaF